MSIIYDALKKVEASGADDTKTKIDKGFKSKPKIYLVYALVICLGFFITNIFYEWFFPKDLLNTANMAIKGKPPIDIKKAAALGPNAPVENRMESQKETPPPPSFILNGVFFSGGEGYALVNNRIVKKGDKVDGATVMQIFLDEVDLESDGLTIKLSTSASDTQTKP